MTLYVVYTLCNNALRYNLPLFPVCQLYHSHTHTCCTLSKRRTGRWRQNKEIRIFIPRRSHSGENFTLLLKKIKFLTSDSRPVRVQNLQKSAFGASASLSQGSASSVSGLSSSSSSSGHSSHGYDSGAHSYGHEDFDHNDGHVSLSISLSSLINDAFVITLVSLIMRCNDTHHERLLLMLMLKGTPKKLSKTWRSRQQLTYVSFN